MRIGGQSAHSSLKIALTSQSSSQYRNVRLLEARKGNRRIKNNLRSRAPVRILVVDDFEPARRSICAILRTLKQLQVVGEAGDGIKAVQKAQELKPDLILLDIGLPKLNGIEVASRLCHLLPGVKILFVTQNNDPDIVRAALSNGAKGFLLKADAASDLLPAIEHVLRGEVFVSRNIKP